MTVEEALRFVDKHYRNGQPLDPPREALVALADAILNAKKQTDSDGMYEALCGGP